MTQGQLSVLCATSAGQGSGTSNYVLGQDGGTEAFSVPLVTNNPANLLQHTHDVAALRASFATLAHAAPALQQALCIQLNLDSLPGWMSSLALVPPRLCVVAAARADSPRCEAGAPNG